MITITSVTQKQIEGLEERLAASHQAVVTFQGENTGTISGHGVTAAFIYKPASLLLTVNVATHPWYISEGAIESNLRKALIQ